MRLYCQFKQNSPCRYNRQIVYFQEKRLWRENGNLQLRFQLVCQCDFFTLSTSDSFFFPGLLKNQLRAQMLSWKQDSFVHFWLVTHGEWTNQVEILSLLKVYDHHKMFSLHEVLISHSYHYTLQISVTCPKHLLLLLLQLLRYIKGWRESYFPTTSNFTSPVAVPHLYDAQALLSGEKTLNRKQVVGQLCAQLPTYTVGGRVDRRSGSCACVQIWSLILYFCKQTFLIIIYVCLWVM